MYSQVYKLHKKSDVASTMLGMAGPNADAGYLHNTRAQVKTPEADQWVRDHAQRLAKVPGQVKSFIQTNQLNNPQFYKGLWNYWSKQPAAQKRKDALAGLNQGVNPVNWWRGLKNFAKGSYNLGRYIVDPAQRYSKPLQYDALDTTNIIKGAHPQAAAGGAMVAGMWPSIALMGAKSSLTPRRARPAQHAALPDPRRGGIQTAPGQYTQQYPGQWGDLSNLRRAQPITVDQLQGAVKPQLMLPAGKPMRVLPSGQPKGLLPQSKVLRHYYKPTNITYNDDTDLSVFSQLRQKPQGNYSGDVFQKIKQHSLDSKHTPKPWRFQQRQVPRTNISASNAQAARRLADFAGVKFSPYGSMMRGGNITFGIGPFGGRAGSSLFPQAGRPVPIQMLDIPVSSPLSMKDTRKMVYQGHPMWQNDMKLAQQYRKKYADNPNLAGERYPDRPEDMKQQTAILPPIQHSKPIYMSYSLRPMRGETRYNSPKQLAGKKGPNYMAINIGQKPQVPWDATPIQQRYLDIRQPMRVAVHQLSHPSTLAVNSDQSSIAFPFRGADEGLTKYNQGKGDAGHSYYNDPSQNAAAALRAKAWMRNNGVDKYHLTFKDFLDFMEKHKDQTPKVNGIQYDGVQDLYRVHNRMRDRWKQSLKVDPFQIRDFFQYIDYLKKQNALWDQASTSRPVPHYMNNRQYS